MPLLATTSHSVIGLALESGELRPCLRGDGLYYGIVLFPDEGGLAIAARGRRVADTRPMTEEQGTILVTDLDWNMRERWQAPFALRDLHEIAWAHGALWATCAYDDWVAVRLAGGRWRRWYPLPLDAGAQPDGHHFNSLWFEEDLVWVLAHRRGPSVALAFPVEAALRGRTVTPRRTVALGIQAHNLWRMDGMLCSCSSAEGCLVGEDGWRVAVGGFPRGVARRPDGGWVVGVSALAERDARDWTDGQLVFFDQAWREERRLRLPGEGLVLDLLWVP